MSHPTRLFAAVLALTLGWSFNASAQKTTTPIFYTDSDLKEKVGFVEVRGAGLVGLRRLSTNPDGTVANPENNLFGPGLNYGGGVFGALALRGALHVGVGVETNRWGYVAKFSPILSVEPLVYRGDYTSFPLRAGFISEVSENWNLEVWPSTSVNVLRKFQAGANDWTEQATQRFWSGGIMLQGSRAMGTSGRLVLGAVLDLGFAPLYTSPSRDEELPFRLGLSAGYRVTF
ncbi:MAG: hypothetical protein NWQ75_03155 [Schleiferiaceae bacterium]|jgi:hypothetical protein|nr:hypothetical protein [Schleiferiaceae bacterium]MDP4627117.1 hypothetical protein [Schleiferiaceae bacterium]MDP4727854.1 hypothetical protein [Schleiferiaceae bacterium]MDP4858693.1 hypothetical protein [Schleiferiaceae bacterium]MDP4900781.1 hypothetical protein [Schleiferiaceae bacterium]